MGMNATAVQRLYVAYFNRPADPISLAVYEAMLPTDTAATQAELLVVAETYFSPSAEYTTNFAGLSNAQIVDKLYQNIFGRPAEAAGLTAWAVALTDGTQTVASLALQLSYSAQGTDLDTVNNRITAATAFTDGLDTAEEITGYSGDAAAASAKSWLATVTDDASLTTAVAGVDAAIADALAAESAVAGSSFTLTTGVDSFTGTANIDSFTGDDSDTASLTMSTADSIDGGTGGADVFNIFTSGAAPAIPQMANIETVNIYDLDSNFDSADFGADVTAVNLLRGDGGLTLTVGGSVGTIGLTDLDVAAGNLGLTTTATATSLDLNLSAVTGGTGDDIVLTGAALASSTITATTASAAGEIDVAAASAVTVVATGNLTLADGIATTATAGTLTVSGAGNADLSALDAGFTTVTASGLSGALTAEIGGADDMVLTGGTGNDVITANTTDALGATDKLAVDAGAGTGDVLVIAATADINTAADGARYSNFEIIRSNDSVDMSLVAGITALQITGGTSETYSAMSAAQLGAITFLADNTTATTFTGAALTGTSDVATINLASATATTNIDLAAIGVDNIETVNFNVLTGTNTTGDSAITFGANLADEVTAINFAGTGDTTLTVAANTLDVAAVAIDASGMTGTADFTLVQTSNLVAGSTVTGTANGDTIALGTTLGNTYNGGAGDDGFTTVLATLVASGESDTSVDGGDGTDTLTISDNGSTLTDNHFTFVSGMEKLTYSDGGDLSLIVGAGFSKAFATGATITAAGMDNDSIITINTGLYDVATTVAITTATDGDEDAKDVSITTGDAADTVTLTAASFVGDDAADGSSLAISTAGGDDTITLSVGDLNAQTTSAPITINPGTGQDTITVTKAANDTNLGFALFTIDAGDSLVTAPDKITGFDVSDGTETSDGLDFTGTSAISDFTNTVDFGTILSHSISAGITTFDDAAVFSSAIVINAGNLDDVIGYLAANTDTLDTLAFAYDSTGSGVADSTMVFNNGTVDSLVLLAGVTGVDAIITTNTPNANDLFVA